LDEDEKEERHGMRKSLFRPSIKRDARRGKGRIIPGAKKLLPLPVPPPKEGVVHDPGVQRKKGKKKRED